MSLYLTSRLLEKEALSQTGVKVLSNSNQVCTSTTRFVWVHTYMLISGADLGFPKGRDQVRVTVISNTSAANF